MNENGDDGYPEFYGFSENPFNGTPDLRFLFLSKNHKECLDSILSGVEERKGPMSLLGEAGTGKTFLTHYLIERLKKNFVPVFISSYPGISFNDLLRKTNRRDLLADPESPNEGERGENRSPGHTLVFLDEAQNATRDILERFQELPGSGGDSLQIIFVGHPEFKAELECESLKPLREKIRICRTLGPLSRTESEDYIEHHLNLVGSSSSEVFTVHALGLICRHGKGIPQTINTICENVLWMGYRRSLKKIDVPLVQNALDQMHASERMLFYQEALANLSSTLKARLGAKWDAASRTRLVVGLINEKAGLFRGMVPDVRPAWLWLCRTGRSGMDLGAKWGRSAVFPGIVERLTRLKTRVNWRPDLALFRQRISKIRFPRLRRSFPSGVGWIQENWKGLRERFKPVRALFASRPSLAGHLRIKWLAGRQQISLLRPPLMRAAQNAGRAAPFLEKIILSIRLRPGMARRMLYAAAPAAALVLFLGLFLGRDSETSFFAKVELPSLLPDQVKFSKEVAPPALTGKDEGKPQVLKKSAHPPRKKTTAAPIEKARKTPKISPPLPEKKTVASTTPRSESASARREPRSSVERLPLIRKAALISTENTPPVRTSTPGFVSARTGPIPPPAIPAPKAKGIESKNPEGATLAQRTPVIHKAFAAREISPGETWKIYLEASALNGDMKNIFAIIEWGNSFPSITRIHEKNRKHFAGYIFLKTLNTADPLAGVNLTLRVCIQDAAGHFSEPVVFPLRFQSSSRPQEPPPGVFAEENLGPIMVQLVPFGVEGG